MNTISAIVNVNFILLLSVGETDSWNYFCTLKCGTVKNTVCVYEPCNGNPHCGPNYRSGFYTNKQRTMIVNAHNSFRNKVAFGLLGSNVTASNMNAMSYSEELEFVAQCWANNCNVGGAHDPCHTSKLFTNVGQNVYTTSSRFPIQMNSKATTEMPFDVWMKKINNLSPETIKSYIPQSTTDDEEVAQMLWAKTKFVGCGVALYGKFRDYNLLVVCNYAVGGIMPGEPVFEEGEPCSGCKNGAQCNNDYTGLCGKIRELKDDKFSPPFTMAAVAHRMSIRIFIILVVLSRFNGFRAL